MGDIGHEMRRLLINMSTIFSIPFLLVFGTVSGLAHNTLLMAILFASALLLLLTLCWFHRTTNTDNPVRAFTLIIVGICCSLMLTGGLENTGILWVYPILAVGLFINRFRTGLILSVLLCLSFGAFLMSPLPALLGTSYTPLVSTRFIITLAVLAAFCLLAVHYQERAKKNMAKLHTDVQQMASFDSLTGLANRWSFQHWLERMISRAKSSQQPMALLYIDLDDFKQVNDRFGHQVGDRLLQAFGQCLAEVVRPTDSVARIQPQEMARLAGDEFAVLLTDISDPEMIATVVERLLALFQDGFEIDGHIHPVHASLGVACYPTDGETAQELLNHADAAMYQAKQQGKNRYHFFTAEIAEAIHQRQRIEDGLRNALAEQHFSLVYMPIFDCKTLALVGGEVLLRCQSPHLRGIGPEQFIPVAETSGLILALDQWVLEQAFRGLRNLQQYHGYDGIFCVNVSAVELRNECFPQQVERLLKTYQLDPACIEIELTETSLVVDDEKSIAMLAKLKALGLSLALDDFGTGYTAFNQLSSYPVDCLKIDRSFVNDLFSEQQARQKMVPIIQSLANLYDLRVIAEGVETREQLEYLQHTGCDWVQGYYLCEPLALSDFVNLVCNQQPMQSASNC